MREGLDRIVAAGSAKECDAILRELPASPAAPLAALNPPLPAPAVFSAQAIVAVMGQTKKLRRAWVLRPEAHVTGFMGESSWIWGERRSRRERESRCAR